MAYIKTVWEDNKTPLDAANLNKIEEGIENAMSLAETNEKDIGTLDGQVAALEIGKQDELTALNHSGIVIEKDSDKTYIKVDTNNVPFGQGAGAGSNAGPGVIYNAAASVTETPDWQTIQLGRGKLSQSIAVYNAATTSEMGLAGTLDVSTPIQDQHATTKKYVDDASATKQDKLTAGSGIEITTNNVAVDKNAVPYFPTLDKNKYSLLSWDKAKQDWLTVDFSTEPSALSVARRTTTGQLKCEAPTAEKEAANKAYVDSADAELNKYLPTVDSWVAGGTIPGAHTISLGNVRYSENIPKMLVLDLNLNRSGSTGGTCSIEAALEAYDTTDPQQKTTQQLFNESAEGTEGVASITGKIILEHDDTDSYFQWKNIYVMYDHYVGDNHVKHFFKALENTAAYYGEMKLAITVLAMSERKNTVIKQYANKE